MANRFYNSRFYPNPRRPVRGFIPPSPFSRRTQKRVARGIPLFPFNGPAPFRAPRPRRLRNSWGPPRNIQRRTNRNMRMLKNELGAFQSTRTTPARMNTKRSAEETVLDRTFEEWSPLAKGLNVFKFTPGRSKLPALDAFASNYDSYRIVNVKVRYEPTAGTDVSGAVRIGTDYQNNRTVSTENDVKSLSNPVFCSIRRQTAYVINPSVAQRQTWLKIAKSNQTDDTETAFTLYAWVDAPDDQNSIGRLTCSYSIIFAGFDASSHTSLEDPTSLAVTLEAPAPGPVALMQQPVTSDINQDDNVNPEVTIDEPFVSDGNNETPLHTPVTLNTEQAPLEVGDNFTLAMTSNAPAFKRLMQKYKYSTSDHLYTSPSVQFYYKDGRPIPTGTIQELKPSEFTGFKVRPFSESYKFDGTELSSTQFGDEDIFSSIFKLAKPLIEKAPMIADLIGGFLSVPSSETYPDVVRNLNSELVPKVMPHPAAFQNNPPPLSDGTEDALPTIAAASLGDSITAELPELHENNLWSVATFGATINYVVTITGTGGNQNLHFDSAQIMTSLNSDWQTEATIDSANHDYTAFSLKSGANLPPISHGDLYSANITLSCDGCKVNTGSSTAWEEHVTICPTESNLAGWTTVLTPSASLVHAGYKMERHLVTGVRTYSRSITTPNSTPDNVACTVFRATDYGVSEQYIAIGAAVQDWFDTYLRKEYEDNTGVTNIFVTYSISRTTSNHQGVVEIPDDISVSKRISSLNLR